MMGKYMQPNGFAAGVFGRQGEGRVWVCGTGAACWVLVGRVASGGLERQKADDGASDGTVYGVVEDTVGWVFQESF